MATIDYQRLDDIHGRHFRTTHGCPPPGFSAQHYTEDVGFLLEMLDVEEKRANDLQKILDMYGGDGGADGISAKFAECEKLRRVISDA